MLAASKGGADGRAINDRVRHSMTEPAFNHVPSGGCDVWSSSGGSSISSSSGSKGQGQHLRQRQSAPRGEVRDGEERLSAVEGRIVEGSKNRELR